MCYIDCLIPFLDALDHLFHIMLGPPWSILLLIIVSLLISIFTGIINYTLLDAERIYHQQLKMKEYQHNKKLARKTADRKLWIGVKRNEDQYLQLQKSLMMSRMLPQVITLGPLIFMFTTLRSVFVGPIAILPFVISIPYFTFKTSLGLSVAGFGFWYFLTAFCLTTSLYQIFGIDLTGIRKKYDLTHDYNKVKR